MAISKGSIFNAAFNLLPQPFFRKITAYNFIHWIDAELFKTEKSRGNIFIWTIAKPLYILHSSVSFSFFSPFFFAHLIVQ